MNLDVSLQRVLLLGGTGLLGQALAAELARAGAAVDAPDSGACDLRDLDALRRRVRAGRPDLVINCAALSHLGTCEADPGRAFSVNAAGAHNAALAAAEGDAALLHVSTDFVFDGTLGRPLRETDPTGLPPNVYGLSKLDAEQLVRPTLARHYIVRVAALFGPGRGSFVDWVLERATPDAPLTIVCDRIATPTYTPHLARQLVALARTPYCGTYHAAGHGPTTWYHLARTALELAGQDPAGVAPVTAHALAEPVQRAMYTALSNHRLGIRGLDLMRPWQDGLREHVAARALAGR